MRIGVHLERWPTRRPFRIAGKSWGHFESVVVELERNGVVGRGEALGVFYLGETAELLLAQITQYAERTGESFDRTRLQSSMPPGGARNALDCALWDLEAKSADRSVFELAGVQPKPLETVFTIGIEGSPQEMGARAAGACGFDLLKIKLDGREPAARLEAIRNARPDARIVIDANQSWSFDQLMALAPICAELGILMIEQPLRRGHDTALDGYECPVPLCADESCLHLSELDQTVGRYRWVNIKLDKAGGLTHALTMAERARNLGLKIMVGNMGGSSLAMAPAFVLGSLADLIDIDGPLLQRFDRLPGLVYRGGWVSPFGSQLWG